MRILFVLLVTSNIFASDYDPSKKYRDKDGLSCMSDEAISYMSDCLPEECHVLSKNSISQVKNTHSDFNNNRKQEELDLEREFGVGIRRNVSKQKKRKKVPNKETNLNDFKKIPLDNHKNIKNKSCITHLFSKTKKTKYNEIEVIEEFSTGEIEKPNKFEQLDSIEEVLQDKPKYNNIKYNKKFNVEFNNKPTNEFDVIEEFNTQQIEEKRRIISNDLIFDLEPNKQDDGRRRFPFMKKVQAGSDGDLDGGEVDLLNVLDSEETEE